ncbi:MAG: hypothetical protein SVY53_06005 [Chloroflexota bacterium]|nr:hypothetical protein [Chloroflexota bacterium]
MSPNGEDAIIIDQNLLSEMIQAIESKNMQISIHLARITAAHKKLSTEHEMNIGKINLLRELIAQSETK